MLLALLRQCFTVMLKKPPSFFTRVCVYSAKKKLNNMVPHSISSVAFSDSTLNPLYSITVLGTGSNEISPCFYVKARNGIYFFNCGPGTFRNIGHMNKSPVLFFTKSSWERIGGVVELFFSVYGQNPRNGDTIKCLGPSRCKSMLKESLPRITGRDTWEFHQDISCYQDSSFTISGIEISIPGTNHSVVAYSCKHHIFPEELGTVSAPDAEFAVSKKHNAMREPCQVKKISEKGSTFIVVECPDKNVFDTIHTHARLQPQWFKENDERLDLIVHITPLEIVKTEEYCRWMSSFGARVHHLFLHSSICPTEVAWRDAMLFSIPFHLMNPKVYHFPYVPKKDSITFTQLNMKNHINKNQVTIGCTGWKCNITVSECLSVDTSTVLEPLELWFKKMHEKIVYHCGSRIENYHGSTGMKTTFQNNVLSSKKSVLSLNSSDDVIVTFLGTMAKKSSPFRNASGILVQTLLDGNIILDCGEATLMQLYKCFGYEHARQILSKVHTIFVSHMHPDHWIGIFDVFAEVLASNGNARVTIIAPDIMELHLRAYYLAFRELDFNFMNANLMAFDPFEHGRLSLRTIPVQHVGECYGIRINREQDWSIVYSGDTKPCPRLVDEGRNTNLLIHEGTFQANKANRKTHSTYFEAVDVSRAMNASFTIITHFAMPFFPLQMKPVDRIVPAVDLMSIRLSDIESHRLDSLESFYAYRCIANFMQQQTKNSMHQQKLR